MPDDPQKGREKSSYSKDQPLNKVPSVPNQKFPKSFGEKNGKN